MQIPYTGNQTWIHDRTLLLTRHGSHAYGLAHAESDVDLKGVAIPPQRTFTGFLHPFHQVETRQPYDMVIYGVRKFFALAADCNPNIIEVLWTDPEDILWMTTLGEKLVKHRSLFLSQKAKHTFSGYAIAQLKRIKSHRQWLLDPPSGPPSREAFDLPPEPEVKRDQVLTALDMVRRKMDGWDIDLEPFERSTRLELQACWAELLAEMNLTHDARWRSAARSIGFEERFMEMLERERLYRAEHKRWEQYVAWKTKRNPKRAKLERQHNIDTKHAMHLVRLMRMCREILETGHVVVKRPDRDELLAIRHGAWSYEKLIAWAEAEDEALNAVKKASSLPKAPDRHALDALCQEIVEESFRLHGVGEVRVSQSSLEPPEPSGG
ncbi:MAG: nucleotidyltransferase domain-containing protein [Myxococcota bacterium]